MKQLKKETVAVEVFDLKSLYNGLKKDFEHLDPALIQNAIKVIFEQIKIALISGDRIEIRGLGSFTVHQSKNKTVFNPNTRQKSSDRVRTSVYFRISKSISEKINSVK